MSPILPIFLPTLNEMEGFFQITHKKIQGHTMLSLQDIDEYVTTYGNHSLHSEIIICLRN